MVVACGAVIIEATVAVSAGEISGRPTEGTSSRGVGAICSTISSTAGVGAAGAGAGAAGVGVGVGAIAVATNSSLAEGGAREIGAATGATGAAGVVS